MAQYPPEGYILARLGNTFFWLGFNFEQLRDWCQGKPVIGLLADEFRDLRDWSWDIKDYLLQRDIDLWLAIEHIRDVWDGWGIEAILSRVWWWWREFRDDPQRYIRERLADWLQIPPSMRLSWQEFWYAFFDRFAPDINRIRSNPSLWVRDRLGDVLSSINEFLNDPVGRVVDWLNQRAEWFSVFLREPWKKIRDWATNFNAEVGAWLTEPLGRLRDKLSDMMQLPAGFWSEPLRYVVDWVIDALGRYVIIYRDTLYRKVHDLLLEIIEREYW